MVGRIGSLTPVSHWPIVRSNMFAGKNLIPWTADMKFRSKLPDLEVTIFKEDHKVLRFCFAKKSETLERAAEKLCRV